MSTTARIALIAAGGLLILGAPEIADRIPTASAAPGIVAASSRAVPGEIWLSSAPVTTRVGTDISPRRGRTSKAPQAWMSPYMTRGSVLT